MSPRRTRLVAAAALILATAVTGCGGDAFHGPQLSFDRGAALPEPPPHDDAINAARAAVTVLPLDAGGALRPQAANGLDKAPRKRLGPVTFRGAPIEAVLDGLLRPLGLSLLVADPDMGKRTVTIYDLEGDAGEVIERVCRAAGVHCRLEGTTVELKRRGIYMVPIPPVPPSMGGGEAGGGAPGGEGDPTGGLSRMLGAILAEREGGSEPVHVDRAAGVMVYLASSEEQKRVEEYLRLVREGRPLIIYDCWIGEVTLSKSAEKGINWRRLAAKVGPVTIGFQGGATASSNAMGFDTVFNGSRLSVDVLVSFLSEEGHVETLGQPQVTMVSGSAAEFEAGDEFYFIRQIGVLTSGTAVTGTTPGAITGTPSPLVGSNVVQNTVTTEQLKTGLLLKIGGQFYGGAVWTNFDILSRDLVEIERVQASGTVVQLPHTTRRRLRNFTPVRPGDVLLLGGLRTARADGRRDALPRPDSDAPLLPVSRKVQGVNAELVVMMRPRLVVFRSDAPAEPPAPRTTAPPVPLTPPPGTPAPAPARPSEDPLSDGAPRAAPLAVVPPPRPLAPPNAPAPEDRG